MTRLFSNPVVMSLLQLANMPAITSAVALNKFLLL